MYGERHKPVKKVNLTGWKDSHFLNLKTIKIMTTKKDWVKFLLEDSEIIKPPEGDGFFAIATGISELEACEYKNQNKLIECLFITICHLFEIDNLELQTSYYNSFLLISKHETDFNLQEGYESPQLSRKKLINGTAKEISEAIISLIRDRNNWTAKQKYKRLAF